MTCWISDIGVGTDACDGPMDRAHLIPKQVIKREWKGRLRRWQLDELVWHPAVWRYCCRYHHGQLDNRVLRVPRSLVPVSTEEFARLWDLEWRLVVDYGHAMSRKGANDG